MRPGVDDDDAVGVAVAAGDVDDADDAAAEHGGDGGDGVAVVAAVAVATYAYAYKLMWHMCGPVAFVSVALSIEAMPTSVATEALDLLHTATSTWGMWQIEGRAKV